MNNYDNQINYINEEILYLETEVPVQTITVVCWTYREKSIPAFPGYYLNDPQNAGVLEYAICSAIFHIDNFGKFEVEWDCFYPKIFDVSHKVLSTLSSDQVEVLIDAIESITYFELSNNGWN